MPRHVWCSAAMVCVLVGAALGQTTRPASQPALDPDVQKAVNSAIKYIASQQHKDGAICDGNTSLTAVTSLTIMALHSAGVQSKENTPAGAALRQALAWVLQDARLRPDGYFGTDGSWMYTHGIATLMLAQMVHGGVDAKQNELILARLRKAVELTLQAQQNSQVGGWRYNATSYDADMPATVCQVRALAAAREAGVDVPKQAFARAAEFVKSCAADNGGLGYVPGRPAGWAASAGGLLALQICGEAGSPEARDTADFLQARPVPTDRTWYLYGCPAYVQAMGAGGGDALQEVRAQVAQATLRWQKADGSFPGWNGDADQGQVYCTALVVISLTTTPHAGK